MAAPLSETTAFLADDESVVVSEVPGTLISGSRRSTGALITTDRRLLFRSEHGEFVDIAHDAIASLQRRRRTVVTSRGVGYPLLIVGASLLAAGALLGVTVFDPGVIGLVLTGLTVAGAIGGEYVRRRGVDVARRWLDAIAGGLERFDAGPRRDDRFDRPHPLDDDDLLVLSFAFVSISSAVGLVAITEALLVIVSPLGAIGGIAVADWANRKRRTLDVAEGRRREEHVITIHLTGGGTFHFRMDADDSFGRELSGVVRADPPRVGIPEAAEP